MPIIESPQPTDQERLVALTEATGFFNAEDVRIVGEMLQAYFDDPTSDEYLWVVYRQDAGASPLGYACYGSASLAVDVYDLYWIAVDQKYRDRKIGSALLAFVEADLQKRNARHLYIETSDNALYAPTRAFYERRGYILAAHFPDYYDMGDGKVIYVKRFR